MSTVSNKVAFHPTGARGSIQPHASGAEVGRHGMLGALKKAAPGTAINAMRQALFGPAALRTIQRPLDAHTVVRQTPVQPMAVQAAITRAKQMRLNTQRVKLLARQMLKTRQFVKASAARAAEHESEEWLAALHLALAAAASDSEGDRTAALSPFGKGHSQEELAELVRNKLSDDKLSDDTEDFLDDLLGDTASSEGDRQDLIIALRKAPNDEAMMKLLADRQGLKAGEGPKEDLLDEIGRAIEEYQAESTGEGQQALIGFNIAPAIADAPDRDALKAFYKELVLVARTWVETMQMMLAKFGVDRVEEVSLDLQKAHAADIEAATPSHDLRRLEASMDHLQNSKLLRTMFAMGRELVAQMNRLPRVQHAGT